MRQRISATANVFDPEFQTGLGQIPFSFIRLTQVLSEVLDLIYLIRKDFSSHQPSSLIVCLILVHVEISLTKYGQCTPDMLSDTLIVFVSAVLKQGSRHSYCRSFHPVNTFLFVARWMGSGVGRAGVSGGVARLWWTSLRNRFRPRVYGNHDPCFPELMLGNLGWSL